jgi:mannosyltransferase
MIDRRDRLILCAILLVGAVLRIVGLNAPLWYDEIITIDTHLRLPWDQMMRDYSMNHHYLHDVLAKLSMQAFGEQPGAIRLPALIFGLATIWVSWIVAAEVAGRRVAHAAALLMALSYHEIWFSQNARGYTGLAFFSTLGLLFFLRGMATPRWWLWIGFGLTLAAAVFTHLTGAFFYVALGLVWVGALILRRGVDVPVLQPLVGAVAGILLAALLYLPILPDMLATVSTVSESSAVDVMQEYQSPLWSAAEAIRTGLGEAGPLNAIVGLVVVGLAFAGGYAIRRRSTLLGPAVLVHVLVTVVTLVALGMRIWPRFFFVDIGLLLILIVAGVEMICLRLGQAAGRGAGRGLFVVAAILMTVLSGALALRNYRAPKQDLAGAVALVEAERQAGERVYAVGYAGDAFRGYFGMDWTTIFEESEYKIALAQPGRVTFVVAFPGRNFRRIPQLDADRSVALTERAWLPGTLGDGGVVILRRD